MSQLKFWNDQIKMRVKLIEEFLAMYNDSNVFDSSIRQDIDAYEKALNEYYEFKPMVRSLFSSEESHLKLEELRSDVIRRQRRVNSRLDDVGFNIIRFLGAQESLHDTPMSQDAVCVSQALGERCLSYLSSTARKEWLMIAKPIAQNMNDDEDTIGQTFYMFTHKKLEDAPGKEGDPSRRNDNNATPKA